MEAINKLVIETNSLQFGFSKKHSLLKNIDLKVEQGSIYGFLGPNGAGKTTTIRLLLGLLPDKRSSIKIFGKSLSDKRIAIFSKIGALIEQPSLYEHLSGYDNLDITRQLKMASKVKLYEALEIVKLTDAASKKVKEYSLGMKQRLGIAIALLGHPQLLILDEPVNGLDPYGMMEMRELLKNINKEYNTTIFLSSHLISEIEKIVSHVGILNMGELVFQGTIDELRNLRRSELQLKIHVNDAVKAISLIEKKFKAFVNEGYVNVIIQSKEEVHQIIQQLVADAIKIYEAKIETTNLEEIFLSMTKNYTVR